MPGAKYHYSKHYVDVWRGLKAAVQHSEDQDTAGVDLHGLVIGWWVSISRKHRQCVGQGMAQLLRWSTGVKQSLFYPLSTTVNSPITWHPLSPVPHTNCELFVIYKHWLFKCPACSIPWESPDWSSSSGHSSYIERYSLGQKMDNNIKLPMLWQNEKKWEKKRLNVFYEKI